MGSVSQGFRVTQERKELFELWARRYGVSLSFFLRALIDRELGSGELWEELTGGRSR